MWRATLTFAMSCSIFVSIRARPAGLCVAPFDYPWLGCGSVTKGPTLLDCVQSLTDMTKENVLSFVTQEGTQTHLEEDVYRRLTDRKASERIRRICGCRNVQKIGGWEPVRRDQALRSAMSAGVSIRQLSRLTAISKAIIERIRRE